MDFVRLLQAILALFFVLGLVFFTIWLIKICQNKVVTCKPNRALKSNRLKIIEQKRLDLKNTVVLISYDNKEFLFLLSATGNLLLNKSLSSLEDTKND